MFIAVSSCAANWGPDYNHLDLLPPNLLESAAFSCYSAPMTLSVCIITLNEEANIGRTLQSVQPLVADGKGEIILLDSGSTDRTVEIAKSFGAKVFAEEWRGFAAQKNSAIDKASGDWILSLDGDEEVSSELTKEISVALLDQLQREQR